MTYFLRIRVGKRTFDVRRQLLLAESEYFRVMFSGDWKESSDHELEVKGPVPTENAAKIIFDFLETKKLQVKQDNLEEVAMAADFFRIHSVFPAMQKEIMDLENWKDFVRLAEIFHQPYIKDEAYSFVSDNYLVVSETDEFNELPTEDKDIIRKLPLRNFKRVLAVLCHNLDLKYFHFGDDTWEHLSTIPVAGTLSRNDFISYGSVVAVGQHVIVLGVEDITDAADFVFGTNRSMLTFSKTLVYDTKSNVWSQVKPLDLSVQNTRYYCVPYCVVTLGHFVYVFGGEVHHRYNSDTDQWQTISKLPGAVVLGPTFQLQSNVVCCAAKIHVLCQINSRVSEIDLGIASYDPHEDKWNEPQRVFKLSDVTFHSILCNDKDIYIIIFSKGKRRPGGRDLSQHLYLFHPNTGKAQLIKKWQHRHHVSKAHAIFGDTLYRFDTDKTVCTSLSDDLKESVLPALPGEPHTAFVVNVPCDFLY